MNSTIPCPSCKKNCDIHILNRKLKLKRFWCDDCNIGCEYINKKYLHEISGTFNYQDSWYEIIVNPTGVTITKDIDKGDNYDNFYEGNYYFLINKKDMKNSLYQILIKLINLETFI